MMDPVLKSPVIDIFKRNKKRIVYFETEFSKKHIDVTQLHTFKELMHVIPYSDDKDYNFSIDRNHRIISSCLVAKISKNESGKNIKFL